MSAKVAILEDDLAIAQMYRIKLENSGYKVEVANDGANGLKMLEVFKPELLLLDLMLPEMNGDEVLHNVRKQPWGKKIKVIVLTNISKDEAPDDLVKLKVIDYVVKAEHTPTQVIEIVKSALAHKD